MLSVGILISITFFLSARKIIEYCFIQNNYNEIHEIDKPKTKLCIFAKLAIK